MSAAEYKRLLRDNILPLLNLGASEAGVRALITTVQMVCNPNDVTTLSDRQIDNVFKAIEHCDTACGFGPGHQSMAYCTLRGPHAVHYSRTYHLEWDESDITEQTHTTRGKTFRLAFSNEGWY